MARATTLFVATDADLVRLFVAVRHALDQPITTVKRNPVMHQIVATPSWDPGEGDAQAVIASRSSKPPASTSSIYADGGDLPVPPVVPAASPALEETAPLRLRALPHAAVVGVTGLELEALGLVLLGESKPPARIVAALYEDGFVDGLSVEALAPLAAMGDEELSALYEKWSGALRLTGRRADPSALDALRALANIAIERGGFVFTHMPI